MADRLRQEIQQRRPFPSPEVEALLNLARTSGQVRRLWQNLLKPWGLTDTQYNVLRILRGAGDDGLTCGEIGERLVTHAPDITRLLERLVRRGLVSQARESADRRVVCSRITADGLRLLEEIGPKADNAPPELLKEMPQERIRQLIDLLEEVRCSVARFDEGDGEA
ncbi:MAG: MarR family winged helix-turn-helix transcriptional regulator [Acidobacteriaceae bacterium]